MQTRLLVSNKVNYCRRSLYSNVSFWFHFYCFVDSVVFFTSSGTSLQWSHRLLAGYLQCKVRLMHCMVGASVLHIRRGFEAIVLLLCFGAVLITSFFP